MEKPKKSEQWLLVGDCRKCRRKNYCKKPCTRRKRHGGGILGDLAEMVDAVKRAIRKRGKK